MFKKAAAYGDTLNSYDLLKLLALATMIVDHFGSYIYPDALWLRVVGRTAFPLFLFLVGYSGSWRLRMDLLLSALLIALCAAATYHPVLPLNILVTILLTRSVMSLVTRRAMTPDYLCGIFFSSVLWVLFGLFVDYGSTALLFAVSGYLCRTMPGRRETIIFVLLTVLYHFVTQYLPDYSIQQLLGIAFVAVCIAWIMLKFTLYELPTSVVPVPLRKAAQWVARNTLSLYVLHVMCLMVAERLLFPGRLPHFRWF